MNGRLGKSDYTGELAHVPHPHTVTVREPAPEGMFQEYLRTAAHHRMTILLCALGGLVLSLLLGLTSKPVYRTRTSLDIRNLNGDFLDMHTVSATGDNSQAGVDTNLQTQIKLLQSDSLLHTVTTHLLAAPHPKTIERNDLLSRAERALHVGGNAGIPYETLVDDAANRVKVKPLGLTRLVEITCDSYDRNFSATFCNTLTSSFEEQDQQVRASEAQKTSDWLTRQVADVRQRAEESQRKLEAAVGGNGLMLSQSTDTAGEIRLRALQDELVKAQADRMQQEALAGVAHGAAPDTLPGVQDNPEHRNYELRLADLRSQLAALTPKLTEQNPKIILLRSQIADAQAGLLATETSSTSRQSNEYAAARHREDLLRVAYQAQEATVSSDLQKAAQVSLLRRELDSEQQLYQTLLQRAKEAGFASAMQASTVRVVDVARPPAQPFSPQRELASGAGLALGGLFGVGFAFFKERNHQVFRAPGEVPRYLHLQELGVIPAAKKLSRGEQGKRALSLAGASSKSDPRQGEAISLTRWNDNFSVSAEAYRNAVFSILLSDTSKRTHSYVLSSPSAGEGKTTVTSNLGVALSKARLRVVLIDGDLRRPALHRAFAIENSFGLRNILRGEVDLERMPIEVLTMRTGLPNIAVIPAGESSTTEDVVELLHSPLFSVLLERLAQDFDVILIDSPPVLHMADARILAGQSDGAILVLRADMTTRDQAATARDLLSQDGVRVVGSILNNFDPARSGTKDYYGSYYRYQKSHEDAVGAGQ